jgi:hypothetical protein
MTSSWNVEDVPHDGNRQQSFATLHLKPNGRKNTGAHNRIPSDLAISRHEVSSGLR